MKLHLGCGNVIFPGWVNVDLDAPTADVRLDLRQPLPFESGSVEFIYNEHFIEHITRDEALAFLKECWRVLRPSGVMRLSTPDLRYAVVSYLAHNTTEWGALWQPGTPARLLNEAMRSWGHQFVFDRPELRKLLQEAGFATPRFLKWGHSSFTELQNRESRPFHHELIVEVPKEELAHHSAAGEDLYAEDYGPEIVNPLLTSRIKQLEEDSEAAIQRLQQHIADLNSHIASLDSEIQARGKHITDLNCHIARLADENQARGTQILRLEEYVRAHMAQQAADASGNQENPESNETER